LVLVDCGVIFILWILIVFVGVVVGWFDFSVASGDDELILMLFIYFFMLVI
jgi:hypothetical protein